MKSPAQTTKKSTGLTEITMDRIFNATQMIPALGKVLVVPKKYQYGEHKDLFERLRQISTVKFNPYIDKIYELEETSLDFLIPRMTLPLDRSPWNNPDERSGADRRLKLNGFRRIMTFLHLRKERRLWQRRIWMLRDRMFEALHGLPPPLKVGRVNYNA